DYAQSNNCSSLAPGASCSISVTFQPLALGRRTASVTITDNAVGSPQSVNLTGIGTVIQISPPRLNFVATVLGTPSAQLTSTMTNIGSTKVNITNISLSGSFPGDYAQTNTCGNSLLAGASCTISVTFTPLGIGVRSAAVTMTDNGGGTFHKVILSGAGTQVSFSPTTLTFGNQAVRTASAPQTI